ncbi:hypothetical protein DFQ28_010674 [Apophysomyces sp. BC1034]|nr:hypothetical protein DFQ28_010674 [Apophysomyces sp. BC1034]
MVLAESPANILHPTSKTTWKVGEQVQIKWTVTHPKYNASKFNIALASGPAQALNLNYTIAKKIDASAGSYNWTIPRDVKPNKKYVLEIIAGPQDIAFAGWLSITKDASKGKAQSVQPNGKKPPACAGKPNKDGHEFHCAPKPTTTHDPKHKRPSSPKKPKKHDTYEPKKHPETTTKIASPVTTTPVAASTTAAKDTTTTTANTTNTTTTPIPSGSTGTA